MIEQVFLSGVNNLLVLSTNHRMIYGTTNMKIHYVLFGLRERAVKRWQIQRKRKGEREKRRR
jgi:hypothetical protein